MDSFLSEKEPVVLYMSKEQHVKYNKILENMCVLKENESYVLVVKK